MIFLYLDGLKCFVFCFVNYIILEIGLISLEMVKIWREYGCKD